jgi:hypothetical protein
VRAARQTIEEPRRALLAFRRRYNETCLIERHPHSNGPKLVVGTSEHEAA